MLVQASHKWRTSNFLCMVNVRYLGMQVYHHPQMLPLTGISFSSSKPNWIKTSASVRDVRHICLRFVGTYWSRLISSLEVNFWNNPGNSSIKEKIYKLEMCLYLIQHIWFWIVMDRYRNPVFFIFYGDPLWYIISLSSNLWHFPNKVNCPALSCHHSERKAEGKKKKQFIIRFKSFFSFVGGGECMIGGLHI